jgi:hypothetical protein
VLRRVGDFQIQQKLKYSENYYRKSTKYAKIEVICMVYQLFSLKIELSAFPQSSHKDLFTSHDTYNFIIAIIVMLLISLIALLIIVKGSGIY